MGGYFSHIKKAVGDSGGGPGPADPPDSTVTVTPPALIANEVLARASLRPMMLTRPALHSRVIEPSGRLSSALVETSSGGTSTHVSPCSSLSSATRTDSDTHFSHLPASDTDNGSIRPTDHSGHASGQFNSTSMSSGAAGNTLRSRKRTLSQGSSSSKRHRHHAKAYSVIPASAGSTIPITLGKRPSYTYSSSDSGSPLRLSKIILPQQFPSSTSVELSHVRMDGVERQRIKSYPTSRDFRNALNSGQIDRLIVTGVPVRETGMATLVVGGQRPGEARFCGHPVLTSAGLAHRDLTDVEKDTHTPVYVSKASLISLLNQ